MSQPSLHPFEARLAEAWPPANWRELHVLLAVSGGPDSVALLRAMGRLNSGPTGRLVAAHFNHGWRATAAADEAFVRQLCARLKVPLECGRAELTLPLATDGLESAGRDLRYAFLKHTAQHLGARYVATGHTADDQAETILHHIVRGTGLAGLRGIRRVRDLGPAVTLIRPMLAFRRTEVLDYLADLGQDYCHDETNLDVRFTRNRIRHELLPLLQREFNPQVAEALLRLGALAGQAQDVIGGLVGKLTAECVSTSNSQVTVDCRRLADCHEYLVRELFVEIWRQQNWPLHAMGFDEWNKLAVMARLAAALAPAAKPADEVRTRTLPGKIRAQVEPGVLRLGPG